MKRILPLAITALFFGLLIASCSSSKAACDAYSNVDNQVEQNDLAQK